MMCDHTLKELLLTAEEQDFDARTLPEAPAFSPSYQTWEKDSLSFKSNRLQSSPLPVSVNSKGEFYNETAICSYPDHGYGRGFTDNSCRRVQH